MELLNKLHWRYAVKKFDENKKINEEDFQYLLEGTRMTASSMGLQAYKIINVENAKLREQLVNASMGQDKVAKASHLLVFAIFNDIQKAMENYLQATQKARNLNIDEVTKMGKRLLAYTSKMKEPELKEWLARQTYIALGNLLTLCAEKNIDACPMEGFDKNEYDNILGLTKLGLSSTVIITLGYRADNDTFAEQKKIRKPMSDFSINL